MIQSKVRKAFRNSVNISCLKRKAKIRIHSMSGLSLRSHTIPFPSIQRKKKLVWKFKAVTYTSKSLFSWIQLTQISLADNISSWADTIKLFFFFYKYKVKYRILGSNKVRRYFCSRKHNQKILQGNRRLKNNYNLRGNHRQLWEGQERGIYYLYFLWLNVFNILLESNNG